jgi:uncharacterized protein
MRNEQFIKRSAFPASAGELFSWHRSPGALERLTPPWETVMVTEQAPLGEGSRTAFYIKAGPFKIRWVAKHTDYQENVRFTDIQVKGPFSFWRHEHRFMPESDTTSVLEDSIEYRLKFHVLSRVFIGEFIRKKLEKMFDYRHRVTLADIERRKAVRPTDIVITGAHGLIGSRLVPYLSAQGHRITRLARGEKRDGEASWDPDGGTIDFSFHGCGAVIHLAGEPIGEGIWTERKRHAIMDSRVTGTRLLAEKLASLDNPPAVLICASAVGYYGDRGDALLSEDDGPGAGFLPDVCRQWENAARAAEGRGIRVVYLRIGVALHPGGGALKRFLAPARLGLGGVLGAGNQYISWISMEDLMGAVDHVLFNPSIAGPVNIVAPEPVQNRDLVRTLARVMRRTAIIALPAWIIRPVFGQMGREVLLASARVSSRKLEQSGYRFHHRNLESALRYMLGK